MMAAQGRCELLDECKRLGIDPNGVSSLTITIPFDGVAYAVVNGNDDQPIALEDAAEQKPVQVFALYVGGLRPSEYGGHDSWHSSEYYWGEYATRKDAAQALAMAMRLPWVESARIKPLTGTDNRDPYNRTY